MVVSGVSSAFECSDGGGLPAANMALRAYSGEAGRLKSSSCQPSGMSWSGFSFICAVSVMGLLGLCI